MFERFTDRARRVVVLAQEGARRLQVNYIGSEHLLLGLINEEHGIAARVLLDNGVTSELVEQQIREIMSEPVSPPAGHIPFTPRGKLALEMALREAVHLGHNYIGTEHVFLGLMREKEDEWNSPAVRILKDLGQDIEDLRQDIFRKLASYGPGGPEVASEAFTDELINAIFDKRRVFQAEDGSFCAVFCPESSVIFESFTILRGIVVEAESQEAIDNMSEDERRWVARQLEQRFGLLYLHSVYLD